IGVKPSYSPLIAYTSLFRSLLVRRQLLAGLAQLGLFLPDLGQLGLAIVDDPVFLIGFLRAPHRHRDLDQQSVDVQPRVTGAERRDRKSTRLNSSHVNISYAD